MHACIPGPFVSDEIVQTFLDDKVTALLRVHRWHILCVIIFILVYIFFPSCFLWLLFWTPGLANARTQPFKMNFSFNNKTIMVTGAGQGIGRAISIRLARCGAEVIAVSRTKSRLDTLQQEEPSIRTICCDLSDWGATRAALSNLPAIQGLVNNAAVAVLGPFLNIKESDFDTMFTTNVKSVVNVSQIIAEQMKGRREGGSIVNLSSQASKAALKDHTLYCGTKGAVDMISNVMALELGPYNIRVNCVNPTVVMTEMGRIGWSDKDKAEGMLRRIPLGRFAEVDEVVNAVLFLLSDGSSMCTGVQLPVDGGFLSC